MPFSNKVSEADPHFKWRPSLCLFVNGFYLFIIQLLPLESLKLCFQPLVSFGVGLSAGCSSFCWRWFLFQWRYFFFFHFLFVGSFTAMFWEIYWIDLLTGKYSDGPSPSDEWFKQGKMVMLKSFYLLLKGVTVISNSNVMLLYIKKKKSLITIHHSTV